MAYPSFAQLVGTQIRVVTDRKVVRDAGGAARVSSYYDGVKHAFVVRHKLSTSDVETLRDFYADNQAVSFDFTFSLDALTYTVVFGPNGLRMSLDGPYHDVEVDLEEV